MQACQYEQRANKYSAQYHETGEAGGKMLLLVAVVQIEDAGVLSDALLEQGLRLTKISSTGGLFGADSVALLMGLDEERYDDVIATIVETCHTRSVHMSSVAMLDPTFLYLTPMEVEVGGAVVFCVPVERFAQVPMPATTPAQASVPRAVHSQSHDPNLDPNHDSNHEEAAAMTDAQSNPGPIASPATNVESGERMKLIVAVVKGDDADAVIRALLTADHRLTRINTTGGFLRRGNATLLVGVKSAEVDEVLNLIQAACPRRTEAAPLEKGLPEFSANIFVLDASHFLRV